MKLAEALILRADYQKRIEQLKQRLQRNVKVQEGDAPTEDPEQLLEQLESICRKLLGLIRNINKTNVATHMDGDMTLSDAIAYREILRLKNGIYRDVVQEASVTYDRYSKSEVKFQSTIKVAEVQRQADALAKEHRELDTKIQEANWLTDLIE